MRRGPEACALKTEKMTTLNDKEDCITSIKASLRQTANWRQTKIARRFPDEPKNLEAAKTLLRLADEADLSASDWAIFKPHFNWSSPRWITATNETARMVGFRGRIFDFDDYLDALETALVN